MPIPVISIAQMREWEKVTWNTGQTEALVIRRVGKQAARQALKLTQPQDLIVILAGKGHNGEDARCAREHLLDRRVNLLEVSDPAADLSKLDTLLSLAPALVIDGLFGIGLNRALDEAWCEFIAHLNNARIRVLALDVPSGLDADSGRPQGAAVQAAVTLTVGAPKAGLLKAGAWPFVGRLEVATPVGLIPCPFQTDMEWVQDSDFDGFPPRRAVASHKGSYGHLLIIAGSTGYHGAAVLAARGAQRAQPGLITLYTSEGVYCPVASQLQSAMVSPWRGAPDLPHTLSAVLAGPGLAGADVPEDLKELVRRLWREARIPMVVDASALPWILDQPAPPQTIRVVTPHPGEAGRLLNIPSTEVQEDRPRALRRLSRRLGDCWVVLKGHQTLAGHLSGPISINSSGNPHLAQGGSGDVLSGFLAGLLAQPLLQTDPAQTLRYGVWKHGAAADRLEAGQTHWIIEELIGQL
jgi:ADP-dependent NAD(P)H-hydrate dehydratase / NAD(P)H-hydrate epimerase